MQIGLLQSAAGFRPNIQFCNWIIIALYDVCGVEEMTLLANYRRHYFCRSVRVVAVLQLILRWIIQLALIVAGRDLLKKLMCVRRYRDVGIFIKKQCRGIRLKITIRYNLMALIFVKNNCSLLHYGSLISPRSRCQQMGFQKSAYPADWQYSLHSIECVDLCITK